MTLGLGMAVTVAPLTTVVMNSVDQNHAGSASGINNAAARLAGVLAIAVFGILMLHVFSAHLDRSLASLSLPNEVVRQIKANESQLASINLPNNLDAPSRAAVQNAVSEAFLAGFRLVLFSCAGLSVASSVFAWRLHSPK
jgi:hypothetical protein